MYHDSYLEYVITLAVGWTGVTGMVLENVLEKFRVALQW